MSSHRPSDASEPAATGEAVPPLVHPTALLGRGVQLGAGSVIGPHCIIGDGVRIGPGSRVGPRARLADGVVVGPRCVLDVGCLLGEPAFGRGRTAPVGDPGLAAPVELGEGSHVGEYTVLAGQPGTPVRVGPEAFVMARCWVGPGSWIGRGAVLTNHTVLGPGSRVGELAVLGGFSAVAGGVELGRRVMVGSFSWVDDDVPPFLLVAGLPARPFDINRVGLRRSGFPAPLRDALHQALRVLLMGSADLEPALEFLRPWAARWVEVEELVEFVRRRPQLVRRWRQHGGPVTDGGEEAGGLG